LVSQKTIPHENTEQRIVTSMFIKSGVHHLCFAELQVYKMEGKEQKKC
jgi:hypothetical protein